MGNIGLNAAISAGDTRRVAQCVDGCTRGCGGRRAQRARNAANKLWYNARRFIRQGLASALCHSLESYVPTILVVDDDISSLSAISAALESADYHVLRASRLDQAGRIVATEPIDLVVLEVATEHGGGWELLREITDLRNMDVIVLSSHGLEEDIVSGLDIGAVDYLTKPFRTNELLARVRAQLRDAERRSGSATPELLSRPSRPVAAPFAPLSSPPPAAPPEDLDDQTPVFMDAAAEHSLLQERMSVEIPQDDIELLPLGQRLHTARQLRKLSLVQIELDTKLRIWYLQAMEESRFGMLPRSNMAEQMVRTYARYLGLDVDHAVADFRAEYADLPVQPLAYLGGKPEPRELPQWLVISVAAVLALALGLGGAWLLVPDQVAALTTNLRERVVPPTATATPTPTVPPTLTPTRTPTPTSTPTATPTSTATPQPTNTPSPEASVTATTGP